MILGTLSKYLSQFKYLLLLGHDFSSTDWYSYLVDTNRDGGISHYLATKIAAASGAETQVKTLGHTQRGGMPSELDRIRFWSRSSRSGCRGEVRAGGGI